MSKLARSTHEGGFYRWLFWCPGCKEIHTYDASWAFNGDMQRPTFTPSLLHPSKPIRCHLFITNGEIQFCTDCGHELAGKTVPLPDLPDWMQKDVEGIPEEPKP